MSYSPTNEADENSKEEFYRQLQWLVDKTPRQDILLITGDLNAQVGSHNEDLEGIMGKHRCGARNENGELLVDFCNSNKMAIGDTLFEH